MYQNASVRFFRVTISLTFSRILNNMNQFRDLYGRDDYLQIQSINHRKIFIINILKAASSMLIHTTLHTLTFY